MSGAEHERLALAEGERTHRALDRYERGGGPRALEEAFAHARSAALSLAEANGWTVSDIAAARLVMSALPSVARLGAVASDQARAAVSDRLGQLWAELGLAGPAPGWTAAERGLAGELIVLALAAPDPIDPGRTGAVLRRLAATRLGETLVAALERAEEDTWQLALGERYASVAHRYAPRTASGHVGLVPLLREERVRGELARRLTAWFAAGADGGELAAVLEAALAHTRTPAKLIR